MSSTVSDNLEQIRLRFDDAWNGPTPPRIEDFLPSADSPAHLPVLHQLVKLELERRLKRGEQPSLDDYRQRFPACCDALAVWFDEARAAVQAAASAGKETDDPRMLPTTDGPSHLPTSELPSRIVGEYELLERLGSGGMGEIYKARHRRLNKIVALKLLPDHSRHPRESAARFQREMQAVGALDHPNVVEAHDAGEQSGIVYLAMKLIDGVDLERLVKQRGPLPVAEACDLVRQAALGLHYLHERGLAHRDVKPSNLMRTPDGTVKVLDLGLARWCAEEEAGHGLTGKGHVMGTPDFLAPEQIENAAEADARADLYGLGGTLFYLLTGRAPFADYKTQYAKLTAHRSQPPPDLQMLRPDVPVELAELVHRLLAKKPEERYCTAAEVAAALEPFAANARLNQIPTIATAQPPQVRAESKPNPQPPRKVAIGLTVGRWSCTLTLVCGVAVALLVGLPLFKALNQHSTELAYTTPEAANRPPEAISKDSDKKQLREAGPAHFLPMPAPAAKRSDLNPPGPPPAPLAQTQALARGMSLESLQVMNLEVTLARNVGGRGVPAGRIGEKVFDPHQGDTVTVEGRLTKPAYAFLIAFRPDGKAEVCFPEKDDKKPPITARPRYPSDSPGVEYGLTDGVGLAAFALVVSSKPLPAFKEWWPRGKDCPWKHEDAPPGVVYRANGEDPVEAWTVSGESRGKGVEVKGKTSIGRLAAWLRKMPDVETVQLLGFRVEAKEKR